MKARDIFGLILRILGAALVLYGSWYLSFAVSQALRLVREETQGDHRIYFINGMVMLGIGMLLVRFSGEIVRFSYPRDRDDSDVGPPPL
jgi:hypothetical protein